MALFNRLLLYFGIALILGHFNVDFSWLLTLGIVLILTSIPDRYFTE